MEYHEREFFIYRLLAGYIKVHFDNITLKVYPPNNSILYDAQSIYIDILNRSKDEGLLSEIEMMEFLKSLSLWSNDEEERLKKLNDAIEDIKVHIYNSYFQDNERNRYRQHLRDVENEIIRLLYKKKIYDTYTCESLAAYAKSQYIIEKTTRFRGKKYNWGTITLPMVFNKIQSITIQDKYIREIARTDPWTGIWSCYKKCGKLFHNKFLSDEQKRIIAWSSMYDNIYKSHECPHDTVIQDDDMLDGWLIIQRREREKNQKVKRGEENINPKIAQSDEIFIMVDSAEAAKRVYEMNSSVAKGIVESRKKKIAQKGVVDVREFDDIKIKILNQLSQGQGK